MRQINILRPQRHPFSLDKRSAQKQKIRSLFLYRIDNREKNLTTRKMVSPRSMEENYYNISVIISNRETSSAKYRLFLVVLIR